MRSPRQLLAEVARTKYLYFKIFGAITLIVITVILWILSKEDLSSISTTPWRSASQISGLIGIIFFSSNFVLATRARILEKLIGGLDIVYRAHHLMGGLAYFFIILHQLFLLIDVLPSVETFRYYFTPTYTFVYFPGNLAFGSLTLLLILTYIKKLPYHIWKTTHTFMGVALLFAGMHVLIVPSDVANSILLKGWILAFVVIGLWSAFYRRFIYRYFVKNYSYEISQIRLLEKVTEVTLKPQSKSFKHYPGQLAFIKFNNEMGKEFHPFTISCAPRDDGEIRFSIKESGDYTGKLGEVLKAGDSAIVKGPYGEFGEKFLSTYGKKKFVWIAGGIGITPFLSLLEFCRQKNLSADVDLFYTVKTEQDQIYLEEMLSNSKHMKNFNLHVHISEKNGHISTENLHDKLSVDESALKGYIYMICGPKPMMNSLENQLLKKSVPGRNIMYEDFSLLD